MDIGIGRLTLRDQPIPQHPDLWVDGDRHAIVDHRIDLFDMVILSIGLQPRLGSRELSEDLDIRLNRFGFCQSGRLPPSHVPHEF